MFMPTLSPNTLSMLHKARETRLMRRAQTAQALKQTMARKRNSDDRRVRPLANTLILFDQMLGKRY